MEIDIAHISDREYIRLLKDPTFLPRRVDIVQRLKSGLYDAICSRVRNDEGFFKTFPCEIVTEELVASLGTHLTDTYSNYGEAITIIEVGAGQGRLSYHLHNILQQTDLNYTIHAVDNAVSTGEENILPIVESISIQDALKKYSPNIILCSRLDMHPFYHFSPEQYRDYIDLGNKKRRGNIVTGSAEMIKFLELEGFLETIISRPEMTSTWRPSRKLQEYILIGTVDCTGDLEKTHGLSRGFFGDHRKIKNPSYEVDGFTKSKLPIEGFGRHMLLDHYKPEQDSAVFSYKRDNTKNVLE